MNAADAGWRARFGTSRLISAQVAKGDRGRGLVVERSQNALMLRPWDVATGTLGTVRVPTDGFTDSYWPSADGRLLYRLADDDGSELGHVEVVSLADGATRDFTPDMEPYTLRGGDASMDGSTVVFAACNHNGFMLVAASTDGSTGPRVLYRSQWEAWTPHVSFDGRLAVIDTTDHNPGVRCFTVSAFDVVTGVRLGTLAAPPGCSVKAVCVSPIAGDARVLVAAESEPDGLIRPALWDPFTAKLTHLDPPTVGRDEEAVPLDWSPDGSTILLLVQRYAEQRVVGYHLETHQSTQIDLPPGSYWIPEVRQPWFDQGPGVLVPAEDAASPMQVMAWSLTNGTTTALPTTNVNPGRPARSVTFESADGTIVQGWLITPPVTGRVPTVIHVHGGPHWFAPDRYNPVAQAWVDNGFAHLDLNYRGSTGRGSTFARQIWGDIGRLELEDLTAARQWLVDNHVASASAMFLTGASYGGYLTLYALARQPALWTGGFAAIAIADWTQAYRDASDAIKGAMRNWFGGTPDEIPELYRDRSPLTHIDAIQAPIVVVHGNNDTRTPPAQMRAFEEGMREHGKQLIVHWFTGGHGSGAIDDEAAFEWFLQPANLLSSGNVQAA
jgi:dienelactone hydrolase